MATRSAEAVASALSRKGFRQTESHHRQYVYHTLAGERTSVRTKMSHSKAKKEIPAGLLGEMARQCQLQTSQFCEFVDCELNQERCESLLREKGYVV